MSAPSPAPGLPLDPRRLAVLMAEEGFAVPPSGRDEEWEAPYAEAERIVARLASDAATDEADATPAPAPGLREALARAIEGGYADDSIDVDLYRDDPVYHAVVYEVRRARLAASDRQADPVVIAADAATER